VASTTVSPSARVAAIVRADAPWAVRANGGMRALLGNDRQHQRRQRRTGAGAATRGPADGEEAVRLHTERDTAVAALNKDGRRRARPSRARRVLTVVLVALFAILLPVTITATWAHRTVVNTDAYIATVGPVVADPAVQAAVSREVTDEIYATLNPQQVIANALPPKAAPLAGPLSNGVKGYLQQGINKILASPKFQQLWLAANRFSHAQLIAALNGNSKALVTTHGQVVLNLVPLLNEALKSVQTRASALLGRNITLPVISGDTVPAAACQKIAATIRRPLPPTCGQIPLFKATALANAQHAYRAFNRLVLALLIVTPLLFIAALWVSPRRRRTLLQLTIGGMLGDSNVSPGPKIANATISPAAPSAPSMTPPASVTSQQSPNRSAAPAVARVRR